MIPFVGVLPRWKDTLEGVILDLKKALFRIEDKNVPSVFLSVSSYSELPITIGGC